MDDHTIIPLVGVGGAIGDVNVIPDIAIVIGTIEFIARFPVDLGQGVKDGVITDRAAVVVPEGPGVVDRIGHVHNAALLQGELEVLVIGAPFGIKRHGIKFVDILGWNQTIFLHFDNLDALGADLGMEPHIEFEFVVKEAIIVAEAKGVTALGIGQRFAVGVIKEGIFFAHLNQGRTDRHEGVRQIAIARGGAFNALENPAHSEAWITIGGAGTGGGDFGCRRRNARHLRHNRPHRTDGVGIFGADGDTAPCIDDQEKHFAVDKARRLAQGQERGHPDFVNSRPR